MEVRAKFLFGKAVLKLPLTLKLTISETSSKAMLPVCSPFRVLAF
jgi:hypothetical protein